MSFSLLKFIILFLIFAEVVNEPVTLELVSNNTGQFFFPSGVTNKGSLVVLKEDFTLQTGTKCFAQLQLANSIGFVENENKNNNV